MTSMQFMTNRWRHIRALVPIAVALLASCTGKKPVINGPLLSPYAEPMTWAVAPLMNESGVSTVDTLGVADVIAQEVAKIHGIDALPVQRVLDGMRAMDIGTIDSPAAARALARLIGADGLIVGSVTAYDPYNPPILGMSLQLYTADAWRPSDDVIDRIGTAASDTSLHGFGDSDRPVSSASVVLDASDNGVRLDLERFAQGRTETDSALNWKRYLVVMDLYTQYVADRLLRELLTDERLRNNQRLAAANQRPGP